MVTLSSLRQQVEAQQGTTGLDSSQVSAISGSGVSVYETLDSLPSTGLTAGDEAFVKSNYRLYVSNGSGWYNTTLVNRSPQWDSGGEPQSTYEIADSATPLTIIARAKDSDNPDSGLINQSFVSDSAQYMVDITNDSSVWTFTPKSADSIGIEVAAGNLTDSNGDFTYTFKWSDGVSFLSSPVVITYQPAAATGPVFSTGYWWGYNRFNNGQSLYLSSNSSANDYADITVTNPEYLAGSNVGGMSYGWGHSINKVDGLGFKHNVATYVAGVIVAQSNTTGTTVDKSIMMYEDGNSTLYTDVNGNNAIKTITGQSLRQSSVSGGPPGTITTTNAFMWDAPIEVPSQTWFNVAVRNTANNPTTGSGNTGYGTGNASTSFSSYGGLGVSVQDYNATAYSGDMNGTSTTMGYILGLIFSPVSTWPLS